MSDFFLLLFNFNMTFTWSESDTNYKRAMVNLTDSPSSIDRS